MKKIRLNSQLLGLFVATFLHCSIDRIAHAESIGLSPETWEATTKGKTAFVKFFAPWCGHCQELAPAWKRLGEAFESEQGLIAELDCTEHEDFCVRLGITAFPTLMHGDPSQGGIFMEEYTSIDKNFQDLLGFAEAHLHQPVCSPGNLEYCDTATQAQLNQYWNTSPTDLGAMIAAEEAKIQAAEENFKRRRDELQSIYDQMSNNHELNSARMMREVRMLKELQTSQTKQ